MSILVQDVTVVTQGVSMIRIYFFILLFSWSFTQSTDFISIEGKVTYITSDQVFVNVGSLVNVEVGDSLTVMRRNEEIGFLIIKSIARNSSVTTPVIILSQIQLGDRVLLEKLKVVLPSDESMNEDNIAIVKEKYNYQKTKYFTHNGAVTIRYSSNKYSNETKSSRSTGSLQYALNIHSPVLIKLSVFGRGELDDDFSLYQARFDIGKRNSVLNLQLGRVFPSQMPGIGITDGLLINSKISNNTTIGIIGGYKPINNSMAFNLDIRKFGGYIQNSFVLLTSSINTVLSIVGQYADNRVDREYVYMKLNSSLNKYAYLSINQTTDIYRDKSNVSRNSIEPTSSQISIRIRPIKSILFNSRLSVRQQVIYGVTGLTIPDSLFADELRTGWYNSLRYTHNQFGDIQSAINMRLQSTDNNISLLVLLSYNSPSVWKNISLDFSSSYIQNLIITGTRNKIGASFNFHRNFKLYTEYEMYTYGYGTFIAQYIQHSFRSNISLRLWKKLRITSTLDYVKDKDYDILYLFCSLSMRI